MVLVIDSKNSVREHDKPSNVSNAERSLLLFQILQFVAFFVKSESGVVLLDSMVAEPNDVHLACSGFWEPRAVEDPLEVEGFQVEGVFQDQGL